MRNIPGIDEVPEWARGHVEQFGKLAIEANSSSDRACAIVMLVAIEELLRDTLAGYLPHSQISLNELAAPGRVAQCANLAEASGLLSRTIAETIRGLNKVRNAFAHKVLDSPSFSDSVIANAMKQIREPLNLSGLPPEQTGRDRFMRLCGIVVITLIMLRGHISRLSVVTPDLSKLSIKIPPERGD